MVIIGHSMGGLISKTLLQDPGDQLIRKAAKRPWKEIESMFTPEQKELIEKLALYKSVPSVRRVLFLAVPHRGANMARYFQVRLISRLIKLPGNVAGGLSGAMKRYLGKQKGKPFEIRNYTGLDGLNPTDRILRAVSEIPLKADVPIHSIIGNRAQATPGGTDGVVEYSSSHLNEVRSELVVHSGHSVQVHPMAIHEVRRILREHLREEKVCHELPAAPIPAEEEKKASGEAAPPAAKQ